MSLGVRRTDAGKHLVELPEREGPERLGSHRGAGGIPLDQARRAPEPPFDSGPRVEQCAPRGEVNGSMLFIGTSYHTGVRYIAYPPTV